jgi:hypothetical protein
VAVAGGGGATTSGTAGTAATAGGHTTGGSGGGGGGADQGAPITNAPAAEWTWVPFSGARCRDGSTTGIAVNPNPTSNQLMILLAGGGACFNPLTCGLNPASFGNAEFTAFAGDAQTGGGSGLFNRNGPSNPVKDWNFVYVPYCTGDVHAGNNPDGSAGALDGQRFVGYANLSLYLDRIVPTFAGVTRVLLAGISAGGFGAVANYPQVARRFGSVPVYLLDDSGPLMDSPYLAPCLAQQFVQTWSLDQTILVECGADCSDPAHYLADFMRHVVKSSPTIPMGLIDSTGDSVISLFFGFGANDCTTLANLPSETFAAGLQDIRDDLQDQSNFGSFVFQGNGHTTLLATSLLDTCTAGGVLLTDWLAQLLSGQVTNVGP